MRFLLVCKQKKNVDTFSGAIRALLAMGHDVVLTIQERDAARDNRLAEDFGHHARLSIVACPDGRTDAWRSAAPLVRTARDWAQYLRPPYGQATKLATRAADRLARELSVEPGYVPLPRAVPPVTSARVAQALAQVEDAIPPDPLTTEFIGGQAPDVVLVTPGLHFGTGQADLMKSTKALGVPLWMLLFSWDNLSTKGALPVAPDLLFVWNERQRREAVELHDVPADRVVVVGAPQFDSFFELYSRLSRREFFAPLGLDPERPTLLYLCSSRFIADDEPAFIRTWLTAVRGAAGPLGSCNVVVRPHPDVPFESAEEPRTVHWPGMPQATGWVHGPFGDASAMVLRTTYSTEQAFFECLHHADAVVALNTSAELEAGIAGRPVFTVLATDSSADGQSHTLHFNYLLRDHGGFVSFAPSLDGHVRQLDEVLRQPRRDGEIQQFVRDFLRPHGDRPVAPLLAEALSQRAIRKAAAQGAPVRPAAHGALDALAGPAAVGATAHVDATGDPSPPQAPRLLRLAPSSTAAVLATPETKRWRRDGQVVFAPGMLRWLNADVRPGDTMYDIGAGVGVHALYAALLRGCTVVAFEPGFAAFKALCDNVVHNACGRRVWPLPVALSDRTGLVELEYPHEPGGDTHSVSRPWRTARDGGDAGYVQPVCAETLDAVVARHGLPPPHVLRLSVRRHADRVLAGAAEVLAGPQLRSVLCVVRNAEQAEAVTAALGRHGFTGDPPTAEGDHGVVLAVSRTGTRSSPSGGWLRRLATRG
jgi:FkbM family methyltransferase